MRIAALTVLVACSVAMADWSYVGTRSQDDPFTPVFTRDGFNFISPSGTGWVVADSLPVGWSVTVPPRVFDRERGENLGVPSVEEISEFVSDRANADWDDASDGIRVACDVLLGDGGEGGPMLSAARAVFAESGLSGLVSWDSAGRPLPSGGVDGVLDLSSPDAAAGGVVGAFGGALDIVYRVISVAVAVGAATLLVLVAVKAVRGG